MGMNVALKKLERSLNWFKFRTFRINYLLLEMEKCSKFQSQIDSLPTDFSLL